jgi:hypothetical protein
MNEKPALTAAAAADWSDECVGVSKHVPLIAVAGEWMQVTAAAMTLAPMIITSQAMCCACQQCEQTCMLQLTGATSTDGVSVHPWIL